jgi:hypothetical protein
MTRQHSSPLLVEPEGVVRLIQVPYGSGHGQISEADLQRLLHEHPSCLPVAEVDSGFANPVPICTELGTRAGPIDNLLVTPRGQPVLVECKLWRNAEARREVVGQILDYAKELSRWTASDLQREVNRRLGRQGNSVFELVRAAGHDIDEIAFTDALSGNLRRGRYLLLIVGDGIREGVEAIAEYLQAHAGLHFSLGLIELPVFELEPGRRLVAPRVLAKTELITRTVVLAPEGHVVEDDLSEQSEPTFDDEQHDPLSRIRFWTDFVSGLKFDDPEQPLPRPGRKGDITVTLPVRGGTAWITVYRNQARWEVGVFLSYTRDSAGARVVQRVNEDWVEIRDELGGTVILNEDRIGRRLITDRKQTGPWTNSAQREIAFDWLRRRTNEFVNALRPRVKAAVAELAGES